MKDRELADEALCGCGSEERYADCCKSLAARYVIDGKGRLSKIITPPSSIKATLDDAEAAFRRVFGRKQQRRDRVLLLGLRQSPKDCRRQFREAAAAAELPGAVLYATEQTGLIVTEENRQRLSPRDRADWDEAVQEYLEAEEEGIDLLNPPLTPLQSAVLIAKSTIDDAATHLGSYLSRSPAIAHKDWGVFIQQLLIVKCFWYTKCLSDRWDVLSRTETAALARGVYECSLLIGRVTVDPDFAETLQAQALSGSPSHPFRTKKDGSLDYSTILSTDSEKSFPAKTSFKKCAERIGDDHRELFNRLYPLLSNQVHFHTLNMIHEFKTSGSFLMWDDGDDRLTSLISLTVVTYLSMVLLYTPGLQAIVRRDVAFLGMRAADALDGLLDALRESGLGNEALDGVIEALFAVQNLS